MDISALIESVRRHPEFSRAGMILCHNGVVRETSRDGAPVSGLRVAVDHDRLAAVLEEQRRRPGIVDIQVEIVENKDLKIGDDVMGLVVAGDIRENVIAVLAETLDLIKKTVTRKTEFQE
jgi:molybdopterin synthase catalytic subunit